MILLLLIHLLLPLAAKDPTTRARAAQAAALTKWGKLGSASARYEATQAARDGRLASYERQADPDGRLTPQERARAAEQLMRAHMLRMSLKAAATRRARRRRADPSDDEEAA